MADNFKNLFESLPDRYLVINADAPHFTIASATDSYLQVLQKNRSDIAEKHFFSVFPEYKSFESSFAQVISTKKSCLIEACEKSGAIRFKAVISPVIDDENKVIQLIQRIESVDEKLAVRSLELGEEHLRFVTDNLPVAVTYVDRSGKLRFCNEVYAQWRGFKKEQIVGKFMHEFLFGKTYEESKVLMDTTLTGEIYEKYLQIEYAGGTKHIRAYGIPDIGDDGHVRGFISVISDISDQKQIEIVLREAKIAADSASRAKSEFLANMSHEIRTPLGAVLGFAELIANTEITPQEKIDFTAAIKRNGELVTNIVSDILDLSKVEVGKLDVDIKATPVKDVLNDVNTLLSLMAQEKGIDLKTQFIGLVPENIRTDAMRLRQILINIVGNAIKFTEKGSVELSLKLISLENSKHLLSFIVKDTGKGLSKEQSAKLFKPFSQGDSTIVKKFGGTGLGLVLSRHLAQLLGGDVVLTDSEPGLGSTFTITIDPGPISEATSSDQKEKKQSANSLNTRLDGVHVLVVDDSEDNQAFISKILSLSGATVDRAENGQVALQKARSGSYNILLMDIQMPVMDGYEATATLRREGYKVPIIALTAHALKDVREHCIQNGFDDYVSKPISRNILIERISDLTQDSSFKV